jgi:hypothetical protein
MAEEEIKDDKQYGENEHETHFSESEQERQEDNQKEYSLKEKEINEKINAKKQENPEEQKPEIKGVKFVFIGLGLIFGLLLLVSLFHSLQNKFEYVGVDFQRIKAGEVTFYHSIIPLYQPITGKHTINFNVYLRKDPRMLESIRLPKRIQFYQNVTIGGEDFRCKDDSIATANLVQLLVGLWDFDIDGNSTITCDDVAGKKKTLLYFKNSSENKIEKASRECYIIHVNDCKVIDVTERLVIGLLAQTNGYSISDISRDRIKDSNISEDDINASVKLS